MDLSDGSPVRLERFEAIHRARRYNDGGEWVLVVTDRWTAVVEEP
jgi:hypothetical protein